MPIIAENERMLPLDGDAEVLPTRLPRSRWRNHTLEWGLVLAGGFVGTLARALISLTFGRMFDHGFPWDIVVINIVGALLLGLLAGWRDPHSRQHELIWLAGATGFLGAFTTFSSFALGIVTLEVSGQTLLSLLYLSGSVALGLVAVEIGLKLGERLQPTR